MPRARLWLPLVFLAACFFFGIGAVAANTLLQVSQPYGAAIVVCSASASAHQHCDLRADGADDQVEINAALDYGTVGVELTEGKFFLTAPVKLGSRDVLRGQGRSTALTIPNGVNRDIRLIEISNQREWAIKDLQIDGNAAGQTAGVTTGLYLFAGSRGQVSGVRFWDITDGVHAAGFPEWMEFAGNYFEGIKDDALDINRLVDSSITGNTFVAVRDNAIDTDAAKRLTVTTNNFSAIGAAAVEIEDESGTGWSSGITVTANTFRNSAIGIRINAGRDSTVGNNIFEDVTVAVEIQSFADKHSSGNLISDNRIIGGQYGVVERNNQGGLNVVKDNLFTGVQIAAVQLQSETSQSEGNVIGP